MAERRVYTWDDWSPENLDRIDRLFAIAMEGVENTIGQFNYSVGTWGEDPNGEGTSWNVSVYEELTELVGGEGDGCQVYHGFTYDATPLLEVLKHDPLIGELVGMDAMIHNEDQGSPALELCGTFEGRAVMISICSRPPKGARVVMRERITKKGIIIEQVEEPEEPEEEGDVDD